MNHGDKRKIQYWHPRVEASAVRAPKFEIFEIPKVVDKAFRRQVRLAVDTVGTPCIFFGETSAARLAADLFIPSQCEVLNGLNEIAKGSASSVIIREFTPSSFKYITHLGQPVVRRRIYLTQDGRVVGRRSPRIPEPHEIDHGEKFSTTRDILTAFFYPESRNKKIIEERSYMDILFHESMEEISILTRLSERVSANFSGQWAFAFEECECSNGWACVLADDWDHIGGYDTQSPVPQKWFELDGFKKETTEAVRSEFINRCGFYFFTLKDGTIQRVGASERLYHRIGDYIRKTNNQTPWFSFDELYVVETGDIAGALKFEAFLLHRTYPPGNARFKRDDPTLCRNIRTELNSYFPLRIKRVVDIHGRSESDMEKTHIYEYRRRKSREK